MSHENDCPLTEGLPVQRVDGVGVPAVVNSLEFNTVWITHPDGTLEEYPKDEWEPAKDSELAQCWAKHGWKKS